MANFYVTNNKYPSNPQLFIVTLHKVAGIGVEENNPNFKPSYPHAERYWKVFIYTSGLDADGEPVGPLVRGVRGSEVDVNQFIEAEVAELCALIDWSQQGTYAPEEDAAAPVVVEQFPMPGQSSVPISSPIVIRVKDLVPGVGIDPSTVEMTVDGFSVTPGYAGNKFDFTFMFSPRPVYFD
jgi:hypothetical protein